MSGPAKKAYLLVEFEHPEDEKISAYLEVDKNTNGKRTWLQEADVAMMGLLDPDAAKLRKWYIVPRRG